MLTNVVISAVKGIGKAIVGHGLEKAAESAKAKLESAKRPEGNAKPPSHMPRVAQANATAGETADKLRARTSPLSIEDSLKRKAQTGLRAIGHLADAAPVPEQAGQAIKREMDSLLESAAELKDRVSSLHRLAHGETRSKGAPE